MKIILKKIAVALALLKAWFLCICYITKNVKQLIGMKIRKLKFDDIDEILALESKIAAILEAEGKHLYVLPKSREDFVKFIKYHVVVGVFSNKGNKLVGLSVGYLPKKGEPFYAEDVDLSNVRMNKTVMIKTLIVDPEYRGLSIAKILMRYIESFALIRGRYIGLTDVAFVNYESLRVLLGGGYSVSHILHPAGDIPITLVMKNIISPFVEHPAKYMYGFVLANYDELQKKIENGYYPVRVEKRSALSPGRFILAKIPELTNLLDPTSELKLETAKVA